jgi:gag-polypeptide of LTR copia-type
LNDEHLEHVRNAKTASEMWTTLKNVFQRSSLLNKLAARRRFYTISMMEDEGMLTYINRVRQIAEELKSMDAKIDETEVAMAVLNGLPSMYDHLLVALDAIGDDTKLTMEFTKSRLLQEEQRKLERNMRQGSNAKSEHGAALVGNIRHKMFGGPSDVGGELTYHRCSKPGHIARYCRSKLNYGQDYARKVVGPSGESANVVNHEDGFSSDNEVCLVGEANGKVSNMEWLIDSGASSHMSACKEAMREYKPFTPFDISIDDKTRLQVIGSGQVKLQLNVQGKQNKCVIKDVLHVPMLGYNLLSVLAMEGHGMETKFSSGVCTIRNKNHSIVALGTKKEEFMCWTLPGVMFKVSSPVLQVRICQHGTPGLGMRT